MITKMSEDDIDKVIKIWLNSNIITHSFIDEYYWYNNLNFVKDNIKYYEVYVYKDNNNIVAFIGLNENYIEGIFVELDYQNQGIGKKLLDFVKKIKSNLTLKVFEKNIKALKFYQQEHFFIKCSNKNNDVNENEVLMVWDNSDCVNINK